MEYLDQYEMNEIMIGLIILVMSATVMFFLFKNLSRFNKKPTGGLELPNGTPKLSYDESNDVFDTPTFKRQGRVLSFDNYKLSEARA